MASLLSKIALPINPLCSRLISIVANNAHRQMGVAGDGLLSRQPPAIQARGWNKAAKIVICLGLLGASLPAGADSASNTFAGQISGSASFGGSSASVMWGTQGGGASIGGALDSANMHAANSMAAGYASAASMGTITVPGTTTIIQSIGAQAIISNSIYGNNNSTDIDGHQNASSSGTVSNRGRITQ
jgi:hypothetical protein